MCLLCIHMCTFLHPHVHVTANLQPGKRICGTRHKKPFEDFASHPLYSISGGKLSQWTKNVVANECRGIKKKKKKLRVKAFLRVSQTGSSQDNAHSLKSVQRFGEWLISNTYTRSLPCVRGMHTEENNKDELCLWVCSLASLAHMPCTSTWAGNTGPTLKKCPSLYCFFFSLTLGKRNKEMKETERYNTCLKCFQSLGPTSCALLGQVGNRSWFICSQHTHFPREYSKRNTMHWGGIKECLANVCHLFIVYIYLNVCVWKCVILWFPGRRTLGSDGVPVRQKRHKWR